MSYSKVMRSCRPLYDSGAGGEVSPRTAIEQSSLTHGRQPSAPRGAAWRAAHPAAVMAKPSKAGSPARRPPPRPAPQQPARRHLTAAALALMAQRRPQQAAPEHAAPRSESSPSGAAHPHQVVDRGDEAGVRARPRPRRAREQLRDPSALSRQSHEQDRRGRASKPRAYGIVARGVSILTPQPLRTQTMLTRDLAQSS